MTISELIEGTAGGCSEALTMLFSKVKGIAISLLKDFEMTVTEDYLQTALICCWKAAKNFDNTRSTKFSTYFYYQYKLEIFHIIDGFKREQKRPKHVSIDEMLFESLDLSYTDKTPLFLEKDEFIDRIPNQRVRVFFRLVEKGYKYREISKMYGISPSGVGWIITSNLKKFVNKL